MVGGVTALPTTALGGLIGTGVGAIHGPFIKLGGGKEKRFEDAKPEEIAEALQKDQDAQDRVTGKEHSDDVSGQPQDAAAQGEAENNTSKQKPKNPSRKPRKIEIRSGNKLERQYSSDGIKRPRKLEVRSPSQQYKVGQPDYSAGSPNPPGSASKGSG